MGSGAVHGSVEEDEPVVVPVVDCAAVAPHEAIVFNSAFDELRKRPSQVLNGAFPQARGSGSVALVFWILLPACTMQKLL